MGTEGHRTVDSNVVGGLAKRGTRGLSSGVGGEEVAAERAPGRHRRMDSRGKEGGHELESRNESTPVPVN